MSISPENLLLTNLPLFLNFVTHTQHTVDFKIQKGGRLSIHSWWLVLSEKKENLYPNKNHKQTRWYVVLRFTESLYLRGNQETPKIKERSSVREDVRRKSQSGCKIVFRFSKKLKELNKSCCLFLNCHL